MMQTVYSPELPVLFLLVILIVLVIILLVKSGKKNDSDNINEIISKISVLEASLNERLSGNQNRINEVVSATNTMVSNVTGMIEMRLKTMQESNERNLEKVRLTVDEKLSKALEERLSSSFKTVSERLEQVHRGLGEMQELAKGVGDLKKVMTNVKTRGILGEISLGGVLSEMLSPSQYETNIATIPGSRDVVEYAVKLPGTGDAPVYIPIDAKFSLEPYKRLLDAYESGDADNISAAGKELEKIIKSEAKDISTKYVSPPHTTDFAVMFLPSEGLYAEVVKNTELFEFIQQKHNILIAGPSTLSALLCSLQMGFKTLAVSKQASNVWEVLTQVKKEFETFAGVLENVQKKLSQAEGDMDKLIGVRTRQIINKLDKLSKPETKDSFDDE